MNTRVERHTCIHTDTQRQHFPRDQLTSHVCWGSGRALRARGDATRDAWGDASPLEPRRPQPAKTVPLQVPSRSSGQGQGQGQGLDTVWEARTSLLVALRWSAPPGAGPKRPELSHCASVAPPVGGEPCDPT